MDSFDNLYTKHKDVVDEISKEDKNYVIERIKTKMSIHDDIYVLIRLYQLKLNENNTYQAKELKNGNIKFSFDHIPHPLQHIIFDYIKMKN
tara:strand:- start:207 stop:479 length:273 start_codon:yes stop_codon:yes gene_type:complete